tara:strand:+ start:1513 stop:2064 length:552 start_codon:yes stop_codon:yes gene_type:complete
MTSMYAVEAKDRVKRLIIQPMQERGWKAPDGNLEVIIGDYVDDLKNFSEDILRQAFHSVRKNHKYKNWPSSGEFISACKKLGGYDQPIEADNEEQAAIKRTNKAFDYASEKLDGNNLRAYSEGFFVDARRYLVSEALKILRQNPDADLDITIPGEKISEWKQAASQRSTKGNINFEKVARKIA